MNKRTFTSARPLAKFGKQLALNPVIRSTTGLEPINEHQEEDIFVVGYPKSGNTWFQNLVSGTIYGMNPQYTPDSLVRELVPDVHKKNYYKRFRSPMFFKSHLLPQSNYRRVIYLMRDGRDAMVSYFHYLTGWRDREVDFMEMVQTGKGLLCKWHDHIQAWLSNPYDAEMLIIKYEDLKLDTVHELQRFCDFVEVDRELSWLEQVAKNATFNKMQNKEKVGEYFKDVDRPENKLFFRRGIIGSYKDEMPPEVLSAFMADAQETLIRCGYPVEGLEVSRPVK